MRPSLKQQAVLVVMLTSALWSSSAPAEGKHRIMHPPIVPHVEVPPLVRFTGTLHSPQEKGDGTVHTLTVFIEETEWQFRLTKVETLTGTNYGWMILQDIFPPELRLSGPPDLLGPLEKPDIAGKPVEIEGRLYRADRMLVVTAAGEVTDRPE